MPVDWQNTQETFLKQYDKTAPYHGQKGALPPDMQLWPVNQNLLGHGLWPQFQIGAYPYCFRLPKYEPAAPKEAPKYLMGQSPGTDWYHAHKHGSTALNVANGMTGALIIEGQYDDDLHKFYGNDLREQVLMIQQLAAVPFPLLNPLHAGGGPGAPNPIISVNGRLQPVVKMRPGEVQLWRIINGAFRDAVQFKSFNPEGSSQPCSQPGAAGIVVPCVTWRQIAQDGVQFAFENYEREGAGSNPFNLASANRADLLVEAPSKTGKYSLIVQQHIADVPPFELPIPLLTVSVEGDPIPNPKGFIQRKEDFPQFPDFLADIPESDIKLQREIVFGPVHNLIDGKPFDPNQVNQAMLLNTTEEWTVENQANDKSHPFHIHVNPFQITKLFTPNAPLRNSDGLPVKEKGKNVPLYVVNTIRPQLKPGQCWLNPNDPATFKPCPLQPQPQAPFVWWDTFAIPTGVQVDITGDCTNANKVDTCPAKLQPYTQCSSAGGTPVCTEYIPGWFRMRTRFADFTGQYVLHCHILIHEDRGMMQLIEVVPDTTLYTHH